MKIDIKKGKEIEFTQQLILLKNLIDNEPYIQKFIDTIDLDPNKIEGLKFDTIIPSIELMRQVFERFNNRKEIKTNNAGKKYEFFSKSNFSEFIQTEQFIQIIGIKVLWNILTEMSLPNKIIRNKIELSIFSLKVVEELESATQIMMDELLNSSEIKEILLSKFPSIETDTEIKFEIEQDGILVPFSYDNDVDEFLAKNDIPLYINYNDHIFRINRSFSGYKIEYSSTEIDDFEIISCKDLKFEFGIFIADYIQNSNSLLDIHHKDLKFYRVSETENIPDKAQSFYSIASQLLDALNPLSEKKKEKLKIRNTFIYLIHSMVKSAFSKEKNISQHLIQNISGLIALDIGILPTNENDYDYAVNDNLKEENDKMRKIVSKAVESSSILKLKD